VLETGVDQPEALALYERHHYVRCPPYGEYRDEPTSVFFEKRL
jgi:putative acetyltransferase